MRVRPMKPPEQQLQAQLELALVGPVVLAHRARREGQMLLLPAARATVH